MVPPKNSGRLKIPHPPHHFSNGPSLTPNVQKKETLFIFLQWYCQKLELLKAFVWNEQQREQIRCDWTLTWNVQCDSVKSMHIHRRYRLNTALLFSMLSSFLVKDGTLTAVDKSVNLPFPPVWAFLLYGSSSD